MRLPLPRVPGIHIRLAVPDDLPSIDALQKQQSREVGFLRRAALEGHVAQGHVLIAEGSGSSQEPEDRRTGGEAGGSASGTPALLSPGSCLLGYIIASDRYLKREELGVIYQINVAPAARRSLVAAALLQAMFDRAAYGCRLFCCWCAQDLEANKFWEAMGFVPLAFRTGSRKSRVRRPESGVGKDDSGRGTPDSGRTHIFWQKPIRAEDAAAARGRGEFRGWWFPSQTGSGSLREDRLVLPIPPGRRWWEAMPTVLPGAAEGAESDVARALEGEGSGPAKRRSMDRKPIAQPRAAGPGRGLRFVTKQAPPAPAETAKKPKPNRVAKKNDPRQVAAARELRDRYLEAINGGVAEVQAALPTEAGKYDISRALPGARPGSGVAPRLTEAA